MIERLKELLEDGANSAEAQQVEYVEQSLLLKGRTNAFREVLAAISQLEQQDGDKDSTIEEAAEAE